ncbi:MAG: hypothetical protein OXI83_05895 [Gemmatimonadota bacterium]|nr:hypothetical protein [Gemmatimonadota bacterium]
MKRRATSWLRFAATAIVLALVTGCTGSREVTNPFDPRSASSQSIRINVENNNFNEATVRAVARTERRLGVVPGNGRESFTLNWPTVDDLRIRIDILAGDRYTTNRVSVGPGETVYLQIMNPVYRSLLRR